LRFGVVFGRENKTILSMNNSFLVIFSFLVLLLSASFSVPQEGRAASDQVADCLKRGDGSRLAGLLNTRVDLDLPGSAGIYSSNQAEEILKAFFKRFPPTEFSLKHSGQSGEKASYSIGQYRSGSHNFRVYFLMKPSADTYKIHQLRFEKQY
jgi:hypothetical protein